MWNHIIAAIQPYLNWRNDLNPVTLLWTVRIGVVLILLGLLWPTKDRRYMLRRALQIRHDGLGHNSFTDYLESITMLPAFRWLNMKPDSDDYVKLDGLIKKAGGMKGLTPNMIQLLRVLVPPIFFVLGTSFYLLHTHLAYLSYQQELLHPVAQSGGSLLALTPHNATPTAPHVSWIAIMWIGVGSFLVYLAPERFIKMAISNREKALTDELHTVEQFIMTLIEARMTVFEILKVLRDSTNLLRPYLEQCVNEFYVIGPEAAIRTLGDRVQHDEFKVICNVLEQAVVNSNQYTLPFLRQHMNQFEQMERLREERKIRMKPMLYTMVLGMPMGGVVIIYFYPFLMKAIAMLHSF